MLNIDERRALQEQLWYGTPAESWTEALPVGNGRLGAMVFGGVNRDRLALNEETVWGGTNVDRHNPCALKALPEVRSLLFAGENARASQLATRTMVSNPREPYSYQPLCDLTAEWKVSRPYGHYRRQLNLFSAEAESSCLRAGMELRRICFVSQPHQAIVYRVETDAPEGISLYLSLFREENFAVEWDGENRLLAHGCGHPEGICFAVSLQVEAEGGIIRRDTHHKGNPRLDVEGAGAITVYLAAATTYREQKPEMTARGTVQAAAEAGYTKVREAHRKDHQSLYNRFFLDLSASTESGREILALDTAARLERLRSGGEDHAFFALFLNYHRYLLIAASRPGCLPSTLQGIWNDKLEAPWESDFHTNVNFQINYWGAEAYHLPECHLPVFNWLRDIIQHTGAETARRQYGAGGWVLHHCTDLWGGASPIFSLLGIWPMGGAWVCRHLYEHYLHQPDKEFLQETALPLLEGAVRFLLDFLVEAPEGSACPGKLVTCPSHSPENQFMAPDGAYSWFTYGCTMDNQIIADIFGITRFLIEELRERDPGYGEELYRELEVALGRLPETKISPRTGCIQEWIEDYEEFEPGHRHVSHLYACYPGTQITPEGTPQLAQAAERTLEKRLSSGYDGQGWSLGWIANIYARLGKGDKAWAVLSEIARKHVLYNLMINAHGNPQVGDAQAMPAALLEMLVQSHEGVVRLLPALPSVWPAGEIAGMRLRGGCALDMKWNGGRIIQARLYTICGGAVPELRLPGVPGQYEVRRNQQEVLVCVRQ